jgi:hypothetical protein
MQQDHQCSGDSQTTRPRDTWRERVPGYATTRECGGGVATSVIRSQRMCASETRFRDTAQSLLAQPFSSPLHLVQSAQKATGYELARISGQGRHTLLTFGVFPKKHKIINCRNVPRSVLCGRGTSLIRNRHPPQDHHRALDIGILSGPRGKHFLVSEVTLYPTGPPHPEVGLCG